MMNGKTAKFLCLTIAADDCAGINMTAGWNGPDTQYSGHLKVLNSSVTLSARGEYLEVYNLSSFHARLYSWYCRNKQDDGVDDPIKTGIVSLS